MSSNGNNNNNDVFSLRTCHKYNSDNRENCAGFGCNIRKSRSSHVFMEKYSAVWPQLSAEFRAPKVSQSHLTLQWQSESGLPTREAKLEVGNWVGAATIG